jgi:hypothetical protein
MTWTTGVGRRVRALDRTAGSAHMHQIDTASTYQRGQRHVVTVGLPAPCFQLPVRSGPVRVRRSCSNSRARRESRFALRSPPRVLITVSKMRAALQSVRTPGLTVMGIVGTRSCPPRPGEINTGGAPAPVTSLQMLVSGTDTATAPVMLASRAARSQRRPMPASHRLIARTIHRPEPTVRVDSRTYPLSRELTTGSRRHGLV